MTDQTETCGDGWRHYEVISPEMYEPGNEYTMEGPSWWRDATTVLARTKREAKIEAVKHELCEWVTESRHNGLNPFTGLTAQLAKCSHGVCWACSECAECERESGTNELIEWLRGGAHP